MNWREDFKRRKLEVIRCVGDSDLPGELCMLAVDLAKGNYREIRIVPGDIAAEGTEFRFTEPVHVIYARERKPRPKGTVRLITGNALILRGTGETFCGSYNHVL